MKSFRIPILALVLSLLAHGLLLSLSSPPRPSEPSVLRVALIAAPANALPPGAARRSAQTGPARRTVKPHPVSVPAKAAIAPAAPSAALSAATATPAVIPASVATSPSTIPVGASGNGGGKASDIIPARYLGDARNPPYPERARERGEEGRVEAWVTVAADGQAREVALLRSSGFDELDQAALDLLRQGPYTPAQRAGVPVASRLRMAVPFRLAH